MITRKEQIEKARELLACGALSQEACDAIKRDFPELAESEDERIRKELVKYIEDYPNLPSGHYSRADFFAYLEKQKEQRPVEWSSLDRACHNVILDTIRRKFVPAGALQQAMYWFNSLPERFSITSKQEWSEGDEKNWGQIFACIKDDALKEWLEKQKERIVADIKSLRPQPQWKPSEEQMDALMNMRFAVAKFGPSASLAALDSLYNDLKNL